MINKILNNNSIKSCFCYYGQDAVSLVRGEDVDMAVVRRTCSTQPHFLTRTFFNLPDLTNRRKVYQRKELVGYSMQQMYNVVSDVDNYKLFVPYCKKSSVFQRTEKSAKGEVVVGFPPLLESYTSNLTFNEPTFVKSECFDGRLFNYLLNYWGFSAGVKDVPNSCVVDFRVEFEFKSALHSNLSHIFFDLIVQQMESAFVEEAKKRYGNPNLKSHVLSIVKD